MKNTIIVSAIIQVLVQATTFAGDLNVVGNLNVASNLTANNVTLQGATNLNTAVLDFSQPGLFYRFTLTNDTTWVFANHAAGRQVWLQITQDGTGGWINNWPDDVLWPGGPPVYGTNGPNTFNIFKFLDDGTHWLALAEGLDYSTNQNDVLQFDGSHNWVEVPTDMAFSTAPLTVEFWMKSAQVWQASSIAVMFSCSDYDVGWRFETECAVLETESGELVICNQGSTVFDDNWHHVAFTVRTNGVSSFFIDGVSQGSATGTLIQSEINLTFGWGTYLSDNYRRHYAGYLDEARISSTCLYTNDFTPSCDLTNRNDTVALWKFNEGTGTALHDLSGHSHDGTLQGSPLPSWRRGVACGGGEGMFMAQRAGGSLSRSTTGNSALSVTNSGTASGSSAVPRFPNLPTSTNGLPSGALWNDGGTLKIVP